jgi:sulfur relay protein TusB/DsrH
MGRYLFIESRDPFESRDSLALYDLAQGQAKEGHDVTVFLIQNGVLPARKGSAYANRLGQLVEGGVRVLADEFSLRARAIQRLTTGVQSASVEELVDLAMTEGAKAIWH